MGSDSPVSMASFTLEAPPVTSPSTGIFSPGRTRTASPTASSLTGTSTVPSPETRWASDGMIRTSASSAREAPITERISIQWPSSMMSIRVASSQKKPMPGASPSATAAE